MSEFEPALPAFPDREPEPALPEIRPYPFWGYQHLGLLLLALVVALFGAIVLLMIPAVVLEQTGVLPAKFTQHNQAWLGLTAQGLSYVLWLGLAAALFRSRFGAPLLPSLGFIRPVVGGIGFSLALGPLLAFGLGLLGTALRTPAIRNPFEDLTQNPLQILFLGLFAVVIGPFFEELVFRGLALPLVARDLGGPVAVLLTSLPFGLLHAAQYSWQWQYILIVGLAGAAFGWLRLHTGSTLCSTAAHMTYNSMFFVALVAQKGNFV